jgi:GTP:adenosylcobinamide-phosphate guanylyltransferase
MIERLKRSKKTDQIVMCTSTNTEDDPLVTLAHDEGIHAFRGDEKDVVQRMSNAAESFGADYILTITGDCPLVDPEYADRIVEGHPDARPPVISINRQIMYVKKVSICKIGPPNLCIVIILYINNFLECIRLYAVAVRPVRKL